MNKLVEEAAEQQERIAWLRVLDPSGRVLAEAGNPMGSPPNREALRRLLEERAPIRRIQNSQRGKSLSTWWVSHSGKLGGRALGRATPLRSPTAGNCAL